MNLPILPLRDSVLFPGGVLPLTVGRAQSIALLLHAGPPDLQIGVVTHRHAEDETPGLGALFLIGTVARIVKLQKLGDGSYSAVLHLLELTRRTETVTSMGVNTPSCSVLACSTSSLARWACSKRAAVQVACERGGELFGVVDEVVVGVPRWKVA